MDDRVDFYKITVRNGKKVSLIYNSYIGYSSYMEVWDSDRMPVNQGMKTVYGASEKNARSVTYEAVLKPGIYYVKISSASDSNTGKYTLQYKEKILVQKIAVTGVPKKVVSGQKFRVKAVVSPSTASMKSIKWKSSDLSIAWIRSDTGEVEIYKPGKVTITASAQDGSERIGKYTIMAYPKRVSGLYVYNYSGKKMRVSWSWQSGVTGYEIQYATNSKFKGAVTKRVSNENTSRTFSRMAKKRYYVRVRAFYKSGSKVYRGPWSSGRSVKITY